MKFSRVVCFAFVIALLNGVSESSIQAQQEAAQQDGSVEAATAIGVDATGFIDSDNAEFLLLSRVMGVDSIQATASQAMLGVHVREVDATLRSQLGIRGTFGLVVEHVIDDSAAAKAGLVNHDVLYKLGGQLLANQTQMQALVDIREPGDKVSIEYYRAGRLSEIEVELTARGGPESFLTYAKVTDLGDSLAELHTGLAKGDLSIDHSKLQLLRCMDCHVAGDGFQPDELRSVSLQQLERLMKNVELQKLSREKNDLPKSSR